MEYFVADTYKNAERVGTPYKNDKGKLYTKIRYKCPRCGGLGLIATRVENGHIVPIPVANGICFQCDGAKYITKEVRLYTEKEYTTMQKSAEKAKEKKQLEVEEKMKREYETNRAKWLTETGFNDQGETYMFYNESYSIKDELKAAGFKFNYLLKWHAPTIPAGYEDKVIKFTVDELYTISAWGKGTQNEDAQNLVDARVAAAAGVSETEWYGSVGEKLDKKEMIVTKISGFENRFGYTNIFNFTDAEGHLFSWFTSTQQDLEVGATVYISGTIKAHEEYKGAKRTVLTRCKIKRA